MIVMLAFIATMAAVAFWWLSRQGLGAKPWLETGVGADLREGRPAGPPSAKVGLGIFLAIAGSLLALLVSAYAMRMELPDWRTLPQPPVLWFNTAVLVLSSLALHRAVAAARRGERDDLRAWLVAGGVTALVFLAGQALAWRQLALAGYLMAGNPANAFFYLITAVHGLHVLGGLVALGRAGARLGGPMPALRLGVELCATYWHFLLAAWVALFGLLAFQPAFAWAYALCTAPFR
jgi:cytochrome c oxidase subunit 3